MRRRRNQQYFGCLAVSALATSALLVWLILIVTALLNG